MKNLTIYKKIIIVSKIIFEIDDNHVNQLTKEFPILTYIIVDDLVVSKINRERDDYACLLIQRTLTKNNIKSCIVSNDRFRNIIEIFENIKPFRLRVFTHDDTKSVVYTQSMLNKIPCINNILRTGFKYR
jgi:DNA replication protein DnaC